jgi:CRISPR/Cas system CSM-associated protein Csm3 (group 7 of RAMP superfamily)
MTTTKARWQTSREIATRWVITGTLTLTSPMRIGASLSSPLSDLPILLDGTGKAVVLPGSSLAGALRAYLEKQVGNRVSNYLFGWQDLRATAPEGSTHGQQSWLMIRDSYAPIPKNIELRDGVAICATTRTAKKGQKYDLQLLPPGTQLPLHMELPLPEGDDAENARQLLATALHALEKGKIPLGGRSRRGFGECKVENWQVFHYDLTQKAGLLGWLKQTETAQVGADIFAKLGVRETPTAQQNQFRIVATFELASPMLIRSGLGNANESDVIHLRNGKGQPIISGTSLAGVVRGRALRILNTLSRQDSDEKISQLFGTHEPSAKKSQASRLVVKETVISSVADFVQTRVKIDRFTGGTIPTALFSEQPVFPNSDSKVELTFTVNNAEDWEKGLLLLVLKDLWTGDLPIGGSSSVGRGRLKGCRADIIDGANTITLTPAGLPQIATDKEILQGYVNKIGE